MTYENMLCGDCGQPIHFDCVIPNEVWNAACADADMLCFVCIDRRVKAAGLTCECEFYASGAAVKSKLYADAAKADALEIARDALERGGWPEDHSEARKACVQMIAAAIEKDRAEREVWLPIETAPRDGTRVLLARRIETWSPPNVHRTVIGRWRDGFWRIECRKTNDRYHDGMFTHWQPIASPPSEETSS